MRTATIVESAVDWVTATCKTSRGMRSLAELGFKMVAAESAAGNLPGAYNSYGYEGVHSGSVSYALRDDSALVQVSGAACSDWWSDITSIAEHYTRLDLQVTIRQSPFEKVLARGAYGARPERIPGKGATPTYTFYENSRGGSTLYVGKGASLQMGRLYDKYSESQDEQYKGCWRYEVQLRQEAADAALPVLMRSQQLPFTICGFVYGWFDDRGVDPIFAGQEKWELQLPPKAKTDAARKLAWLCKAVRPTVAFLLDLEMTCQTLAALGLSDVLDPTSLPEFSEPNAALAALYAAGSENAKQE